MGKARVMDGCAWHLVTNPSNSIKTDGIVKEERQGSGQGTLADCVLPCILMIQFLSVPVCFD